MSPSELDNMDLQQVVENQVQRRLASGQLRPGSVYQEVTETVDRALITQVMQRVDDNQVHAAKMLGINRNTLRKKLVRFGLIRDSHAGQDHQGRDDGRLTAL